MGAGLDDDYEQEDFHYLDEDDYDEFVARELDGKGGFRGAPPVPVLILIVIAILLVLTLVLTR